jgi:hypothetical protein
MRALDPLIAAEASTDTLLVGRVVDRSALHGFIARIEALGLELVELQRLPPARSATGCCPECGAGRDLDARAAESPRS